MRAPRHRHAYPGILAALALVLALVPATPAMPSAQAAAGTVMSSSVLLRFDTGAERTALRSVDAAGLQVRRPLFEGVGVVVIVPAGLDAEAYARALSVLPGVAFAEPDRPIEPQWVPDDPGYASQWAYPHIQAPTAWDVTTGDPGVVVALLDTGIDLDHPDLAGNILPGGYDFGEGDSDPSDLNGHGTHCAGIVAAETDNAVGVAGTAPHVSLLPVKVFQDGGGGTTSMLADGIRFAVDAGADIISMSLGGEDTTVYLEEAIAYARGKGVIMVASAGNRGIEGLLYPAASPGVIGVTATTVTDARATYANYGADVDIAAPGSEIYSTVIDGYGTKTGTSMAAPYVSGALALLRSAWPAATPGQLVAALQATASDMGDPGWDELTGFGRIQVRDAIDHLGGPYSWDATAPVTVSDAVGSYLHTATVTFEATDAGGSGVAETYLRIDGGTESTGTVATVTGYGTHTIAYRSVDLAGNPERTKTVTFSVVEFPGPVAERLAGLTRYDTCVELSLSTYAGSSVSTVVVASGEVFADALSASSLAGAYGSPLMLTAREALPDAIRSEILRVGAVHAVIVGGTGAVGDEVERALVGAGLTIERVAGADRYATSAAVARALQKVLGVTMPRTVLVARGDDFPDALSLAALASGQGMPVLLTRPDVLPAVTAQVIEEVDAGYVVLAGGEGAVLPEVAVALDDVPGIVSVIRLKGADRYATAAAVASYGVLRGWADPSYIGLGTGADFPDALGGGVVAGARGGVLLLTRPDVLSQPSRDFITEQSDQDSVTVVVYGGTGAISDDVLDEVNAIRF